MTMTDPIADMLTRLRNAVQARHQVVEMPASTVKVAIAEVLRDEGYIKGFSVQGEVPKKQLRVELRYTGKQEPVLTGLRRVSTPGLRVYTGADEIPRVFGGLGVAILSTSKGVMSGAQARRRRLGGEVLCQVW
ncbi:MAG TPA: 30S ribosomal protein S8 [Chloroflexota bacterium]|nr:30S ribosomal protein S8 [Chloroflexota bacterium]